MLEITKYSNKNYQDLLSCVEKLQDFIVNIDPEKLNIRTNEYGKISLDTMLEKVKNNNGVIYLAYDNEKIVWFITWIFGFTEDEYKHEFKNVKIWEVIELFVDENYRWQKLWQKLMDFMEKYFKENNCEYISIDVFAPNIWAYKFYEKLWFKNRMITMSKKI